MAYQEPSSDYLAWAYQLAGTLGVSVATAFYLTLAAVGFVAYKITKK